MSNGELKTSRAANVSLWILQGLLAAMFLMAGISKLSGDAMMVENFEKLGMGQWFRYVTGGIELVAAVLLVIPRVSVFGAILLACTMVGATVAHMTVLGGTAIPAIVLGTLAAVVVYGRRGELTSTMTTRTQSHTVVQVPQT